MNVIRPRSLLIVSLPLVVIGVDPDSDHTAYAVFTREPSDTTFALAEIDGGGSGRVAVPWGDVTGALAVVSRWRARAGDGDPTEPGEPGTEGGVGPAAAASARLLVGIEAQLASGGAHTSDVEGCRRARWHWDAACHLLAVQREHVDPGAWQSSHDTNGRRLATGDVKREYRRLARELDPRADANEDRAAAVGIAAWCIRQRGGEVVRSITK